MDPVRPGRWLAAGAFALYALVAGVLLPLHAILEGAGPRADTDGGPAVAADCRDRDCREPAHRHHSGGHDAATCPNCAHARAAASPAAAVAAAEEILVRTGGTEPSPSAILPAAGRSRHAARAPPVLS